MTFKDFDIKINILSAKLNISQKELKTWKMVDVVKSLQLMNLV